MIYIAGQNLGLDKVMENLVYPDPLYQKEMLKKAKIVKKEKHIDKINKIKEDEIQDLRLITKVVFDRHWDIYRFFEFLQINPLYPNF